MSKKIIWHKKATALFLCACIILSIGLTGCTASETGEKIKVGMVTDTGSIDDKSFNQGTWQGILMYSKDKQTIQEKYLQPSGAQATDLINAINDLVDSGYKILVTPGYKFETAINESAKTHPDTKFILLDGLPHSGDNIFVKHDNVLSVFFSEQEGGFLAGVAAALSTKTGKLGFIGGSEVLPVQKFLYGFEAGVEYADDKLGANAEIVSSVYQGTFNDIQAGQTLAAGMYDKGIDIIFHAAGGVGVGVFNEAKQRAKSGQNVWVIGVDSDQYDFGKIEDKPDAKSVTLTSAIKKVDVATYNYIDAAINNKFPGGEVITLSIKEDGIGLPAENPNLSDAVKAKIDGVTKDMKEGKIAVPSTEEELDNFLK